MEKQNVALFMITSERWRWLLTILLFNDIKSFI